MNINMGSCNKVTINGVEYSGNNVSVRGDKIIIDGKEIMSTDISTVFNISVEGNVASIDNSSGTVTCNDAGSVSTQSGDVVVSGSVNGNVETMSGDVTVAGHIKGNTETMSGDIITGR